MKTFDYKKVLLIYIIGIVILVLLLLTLGCYKDTEPPEPKSEWYLVMEEYPAPMYNYPHRVNVTFFPCQPQISYYWERKDAFVTQSFIFQEDEWQETICTKPRPTE